MDRTQQNKGMKVLKKIFYISIVAVVLIDFFVHRSHPIFFWDKIYGFSALYGFLSCVLIIVVSKTLGRWLMRDEDYYD